MWKRQIKTALAGRCKVCRLRISRGTMVWVGERGEGMACAGCHRPDWDKPQPAPDAPRSTPAPRGGDAMAEWGGPLVADVDGWARRTLTITQVVALASSGRAASAVNGREKLADLERHLDGTDPWACYYTKQKLADGLAKCPQHILEEVQSLRDELVDIVRESRPQRPRRRIIHGQIDGHDICADRFLARVPECWDAFARTARPSATARIAVNQSCSAYEKEPDLLYRGAAAAALADIWTVEGISVEVSGITSLNRLGVNPDTHALLTTICKQTHDPLDIGALGYCLASLPFWRLATLYGTAFLSPGETSGGFGHPEPMPTADRAGYDVVIEKDVKDRSGAIAAVKAALGAWDARKAA